MWKKLRKLILCESYAYNITGSIFPDTMLIALFVQSMHTKFVVASFSRCRDIENVQNLKVGHVT